MDSRKMIIKETGIVAAGILCCSAIMVAIFAALGYFSMNVLWGAILGSIVIIGNYFFLSITVSLASAKAEQGDTASGQKMLQTSGMLRLVAMGLLLFVFIKMGFNVLALVLPLAFLRPVLMLWEFFGKRGGR